MQSDRTCGREQSNIYFLQDAIGAVGRSPPSVFKQHSTKRRYGLHYDRLPTDRFIPLIRGVVSAPVSRRVMGGTSSRITGKLLTYRSIFIVFEFLNKSIWTEKRSAVDRSTENYRMMGMKEKVLCYKIRKGMAEKIRKLLDIDYGYKPRTGKDYVYFAVSETLRKNGLEKVLESLEQRGLSEDVDVEEKSLERKETAEGRLRDILIKKGIPPISSYEIVGSIAVLSLPEEAEPYGPQIAEELMKIHKNVRTVVKKKSGMSGRWRVREVEVIAGEPKTETVYKENGCVFRLDISKMYYSTRLSYERKRISNLVRPGEHVLVPFAGYGPFAITIAKHNKDVTVVGIEINPHAVKYFQENVKLNRLGNVKVVEGDALEKVKEFKDWADRIVMPLPKNAIEHVPEMLTALKDEGVIHVYAFAPIDDPFSGLIESLKKVIRGFTILKIDRRIVRPYSPTTVQVVLDIYLRRRKRNQNQMR